MHKKTRSFSGLALKTSCFYITYYTWFFSCISSSLSFIISPKKNNCNKSRLVKAWNHEDLLVLTDFTLIFCNAIRRFYEFQKQTGRNANPSFTVHDGCSLNAVFTRTVAAIIFCKFRNADSRYSRTEDYFHFLCYVCNYDPLRIFLLFHQFKRMKVYCPLTLKSKE